MVTMYFIKILKALLNTIIFQPLFNFSNKTYKKSYILFFIPKICTFLINFLKNLKKRKIYVY